MFVTKVSTISAMLFTLGCHVIGKTVNGKHVRPAVAYDPVVTGTVDHLAHSLSDGKESDRLLQLTRITSCDEGEEPNLLRWFDGTCLDGSGAYDCCIRIETYTKCDEGYYPYPKNWKDGVCSSSVVSDCCVTFVTSCDEPGEGRIIANFDWDFVNEYFQCYPGISECCGPLQNISTIICNGALPLQKPGLWNDGVCSVAVESGSVVVQSDCCYFENGSTKWGFIGCSESQEQIPGKWNNGFCAAYYAKNCCRSVSGTTSSGNGGTSSSGNGGTTSSGNGGSKSSESSSAGLIGGIVFGLLIILVLVLLAYCCSKNQPSPTTTTGASSNKPVKEEAVDTEDRSVTDVPPETAAPGSHGPPPPAAAAAPMTLAEISDALVLALRISQTSSNVASTVESVTESANNISEIVAIASALAGVPLEV
jgi:uncharacterized membrane protein YgcG